jgi:chromosome segregation ATPase
MKKLLALGTLLALAVTASSGQVVKGPKAAKNGTQKIKVTPALRSRVASLNQQYRQQQQEYQRMEHSLARLKSNKRAVPTRVAEFERELNSAGSQMRELQTYQQQANQLSSLSEMGETESLRLQMAMDRMSKMMSTLSNLLKKTSETDQGIAQNTK